MLSRNVNLLGKYLVILFFSDRKSLMKQIQQVVVELIKSINSGEAPSIVVRNSKIWKNCEFSEM